ncbi:MAG TPA: hypothetical protein VE524_01100, partial [Nitrososphaeraceae archaeon]|nr:hypothetical protein [Nitrososphaeraceae archaeon]
MSYEFTRIQDRFGIYAVVCMTDLTQFRHTSSFTLIAFQVTMLNLSFYYCLLFIFDTSSSSFSNY